MGIFPELFQQSEVNNTPPPALLTAPRIRTPHSPGLQSTSRNILSVEHIKIVLQCSVYIIVSPSHYKGENLCWLLHREVKHLLVPGNDQLPVCHLVLVPVLVTGLLTWRWSQKLVKNMREAPCHHRSAQRRPDLGTCWPGAGKA